MAAKIIQIEYDPDAHGLWCLTDSGDLFFRSNSNGTWIVQNAFLPDAIKTVNSQEITI